MNVGLAKSAVNNQSKTEAPRALERGLGLAQQTQHCACFKVIFAVMHQFVDMFRFARVHLPDHAEIMRVQAHGNAALSVFKVNKAVSVIDQGLPPPGKPVLSKGRIRRPFIIKSVKFVVIRKGEFSKGRDKHDQDTLLALIHVLHISITAGIGWRVSKVHAQRAIMITSAPNARFIKSLQIRAGAMKKTRMFSTPLRGEGCILERSTVNIMHD